ncbi:enolase C-terminal domain-like protein [Methanopyrus sp.]
MGSLETEPVSLSLKRPFRISGREVRRVRGYWCTCVIEGDTGRGFGLCRGIAEEMAILDAAARRYDEPLCTVLGGEPTSIESFATVDLVGTELAEKLARRYYLRGYRKLKVKVGGDLKRDLERLEACVESAEFDALILDGNEGLTVEGVFRLLDLLDFDGDVYLEHPTPPDSLEEVCESCEVPVIVDVMDLGARSIDDVLDVAEPCDIVNIKAQEAGFVGGLRLARDAQEEGFRVMIGCVVESFSSVSAAAHLAAAVEADLCDLDGHLFLNEDVVSNPRYAPVMVTEGPGWEVRMERPKPR